VHTKRDKTTVESAWDRQSLIQNVPRSSYREIEHDLVHIQPMSTIHLT
jgi:hypothetical protein